jgi:hypothetical protein
MVFLPEHGGQRCCEKACGNRQRQRTWRRAHRATLPDQRHRWYKSRVRARLGPKVQVKQAGGRQRRAPRDSRGNPRSWARLRVPEVGSHNPNTLEWQARGNHSQRAEANGRISISPSTIAHDGPPSFHRGSREGGRLFGLHFDCYGATRSGSHDSLGHPKDGVVRPVTESVEFDPARSTTQWVVPAWLLGSVGNARSAS